MALTPQEAAGAMRDAGWPRELWPVMVAIAKAESGLRIDAVGGPNSNGTYDYGLLQINSVHRYDKDRLLTDPIFNAKAGLSIWHGQGLRAWTTYSSGAYRQFLPIGQQGAAAPVTPSKLDGTRSTTKPGDAGKGGGGGGVLDKAGDVLGTVALGPLGFLIDGKGNPISDVGHAVASIATNFAKAAVWMADPHNWLRIVEVIGGTAAVLLSLHMLANTGIGGPVGTVARGVSTAENAAGKVAKTAGFAGAAAATGGASAAAGAAAKTAH